MKLIEKIAIVGSRICKDYNLLDIILNNFFKENNNFIFNEIISGAAYSGVDKNAALWAKNHDIKLTEFPADWYNLQTNEPIKIKKDKNGKSYNILAGMNRNTQIVEACTCLLALQKDFSKGTSNSIEKARKLKKPVFIFSF